MNLLYIFMSFLLIKASFAFDKNLAAEYSIITESYSESRKSNNPDAVATYISSRINPDFMDVVENDFISVNLSSSMVEISRPTNSPKMRTITSCKSEIGSVTIEGTKLIVTTDRFPVRVLCTGENGNYREAYITFKK